ncbi:MAG: hypothetical protein HZB39_18065 [Planctomycetes bacterium]|nr:hypothetical protein [Planctomycetota bacterium]
MRRCSILAIALAIAVAVLFGAAALLRGEPGATPITGDAPPSPDLRRAEPAPQVGHTVDAVIERTSVAAAVGPAEAPLDFDAAVTRLVGMGVELSELVARGDQDAAMRRNQDVGELLARVLTTFPDAGERAVDRMTALSPADASLEANLRRQVLVVILRSDLEERQRRTEKGTPRGAVDALVAAILAIVPQDEPTANTLGAELLVDHPYLGPAHEDPVLELVTLSATETWLTQVASDLLRTLWRNLEKTGARARSDLASLALLFFDDVNQARRLAAIRELVRDPRLRRIAIERAHERRDAALAGAIGNAAAAELDAATAFEIVRELHELGGSTLIGPCVIAAGRDPPAARRAYEEALADSRDAGLRADLLMASAMGQDGPAVELARTALRDDPDPVVRGRAMLALTAQPDASVGERAIFDALDDPRSGSDADLAKVAIHGLENLARLGDRNVVQRVGQRLASHPLLAEADRARVRAVVGRVLGDSPR